MDALARALASVDERLAKARAEREAKAPKAKKPATVRQIIQPQRRREYRTAYEDEARALAAQGKTAKEIAVALNVSPNSISGWAKRRGVKLAKAEVIYHNNFAKRHLERKFDYAEAARLYAEGVKVHAIAQQLGVSQGAIRLARIAMGLPPRRPNGQGEFVNGEGWR